MKRHTRGLSEIQSAVDLYGERVGVKAAVVLHEIRGESA
jgi:hypothetical protein